MKKLLTICLISMLITLSSVSAAEFTNFIADHQALQKKLAKLESRITINSNLLNSEDSKLRPLKKDLKKINKRHKKIYKSLVKKFQIPREALQSVKAQQKLMQFKRNDDQLQVNLKKSYELAMKNNKYLESITEDSKAAAFTDSLGSGLYGQVSMITGNCMPQAGKQETFTCQESAFPTTVVIRELTAVKELDKFVHYAGSKEPIIILSTNDKGIYKLDLAPGEYSVFILDDNDKEYCDNYDAKANACSVTIIENMYSEFNASLDRAAY